MTTNIWLGKAVSNYKVVTVTCSNLLVPVQIGLGNRLMSFLTWDAAAISKAWNNNTDTFFAEITASVSGTGPAATLVLTANNLGEDFELTCSQNVAVAHGSSTYQTITFDPLPSGGTFTLTVAGSTTGNITYSTTPTTLAANIQAAIAAMTGFSAGDVTVTAQATTGVYLFDFSTGRFVGTNVPAITATHTSLTGGTASSSVTRLALGNAGTTEVVTISFPIAGTHTALQNTLQTLATTVTQGTFTATVTGYGTTRQLPWNCGRSVLQSALEAVVGVGNVLVTAGPLNYLGTYYTLNIAFQGALAGLSIASLTIAAYGNAVNAHQQLTLRGAPTSGTFTMTFGAQTTSALAYNASAATIQAALVALSSIGAGNVLCQGGPLTTAGAASTNTLYASTAACLINDNFTSPNNQSGVYLEAAPAVGSYSERITYIRFTYTGQPTSAILNFFSEYTGAGLMTGMKIGVIDADDAVIPPQGLMPTSTTVYQIGTYTTAPIYGSVAAGAPAGSTPNPPANPIYSWNTDVSSLIAHVQARSGWVDGNHIVFQIRSTTNDNWINSPAASYISITQNFTAGNTYAPVDIYFQGSMAGTSEAAITTTGSLSAGGSAVVQVLAAGGASGAYTSTVTQVGGSTTVNNIAGGTFALNINGTICGPIPYNTTAANLVSIINATFGGTVCSATGGPAPGTPIVITFAGALALLPVSVTYINSLQLNEPGSVVKTVITSGVAAATATNVWDMVVCPGEGTLGILPDATYAHIEINITNNLPALQSPSTSRPVGTIYVPLFGMSALMVQSAINEAMGCDACRVCKVGHSQEWANVQVPATLGSYSVGQPTAFTQFWYMKDTYRIVFINQFAAAGATALTASFPLISGIPATPASFMYNTGTILNPTTSDPLDLFPEINRVVVGFNLMAAAATPLHVVSVSISTVSPANNVSWRVKLLSQYADGTTHTGLADYIDAGKITFQWCTKQIDNNGVATFPTVLASSAVLDWNSPASAIQLELSRMAQGLFGANVVVTGSLNNSWLSESTKDAPTTSYNELLITLAGQFYGMPIDEFGYDLVCIVSQPQFPTNSTFQKNFKVWMGHYTRTLPPHTNQRERVTISSPASLANVALGVNNFLFQTSPLATAAQIQAAFDAAFGATASAFLPEKLAHPVFVYGTNWTEGALEFEFSSYGLAQSSTVTLWVGTQPLGIQYGVITVGTQGVAVTDDQQLVSILGAPYSGTFTVSWGGNTTAAIAYNATLSTFTAALAAATPSAIALTTVTGDPINGFILDWAAAGGPRALATTTSYLNNGKIVNDLATVTNLGGLGGVFGIIEATKGTGPSYWDSPDNWSLQHIPTSDENVVIDDSTSPILYGIDQSSYFNVEALGTGPAVFSHTRKRPVFANNQQVQLVVYGTAPTGLTAGARYNVVKAKPDGTFQLQTTAGVAVSISTAGSGKFLLVVANLTLQVYNRFGGAQIGLPHQRAALSPEYLACYLRAYFASIDTGTVLAIGKFDTVDNATNIVVGGSADAASEYVPSIMFLMNNTGTNALVEGGAVGFSVYAEESSVGGTITINNGFVLINNATINKITKSTVALPPVITNSLIVNQTNIQ